jgi:hypothetical protein
MNEHVKHWLEAYYDDELEENRRRQVESHLAHCPSCRAELERLETLSTLLRSSPVPQTQSAPARFVAQVGLRLPRRPERPAWQRALKLGWQLMPAGLLSAWVALQAAFIVTGLLMAASQTGPGQVLAAILPFTTPQSFGPAGLAALSGANLSQIISQILPLLSSGGPLGWGFTVNLLLSLLLDLLYCSWIASWWAVRQHQGRQLISGLD